MESDKKHIVGIDEAGRGPWAGPVVAACSIFSKNMITRELRSHITDSKKVPEKMRERLFQEIKEKVPHGIGVVSAKQIDKLGIKRATHKAMQAALKKMQKDFPELEIKKIYIDGSDKFQFAWESEDLVKGDEKRSDIAASSILAKVWRDKFMVKAAKKYPEYEFESHKGYGTKKHSEALKKHGPCEIHRLSYKPIQEIMNQA